MIVWAAKKPEEGIPVVYSNGQQVVLVVIRKNGYLYAVIKDDNVSSIFIERIKSSILPHIYKSENFEKIESSEEWEEIYQELISKDIYISPEIK